MTATVFIGGLLPILWSPGAGAAVMKRIATSMVGGICNLHTHHPAAPVPAPMSPLNAPRLADTAPDCQLRTPRTAH